MIQSRNYFRGAEFAAILALAVGYLASWRLQMEPGTIGLFHDWSISPAATQNVAYANQLFDGWYRWILGEPVLYPTEYPIRFLFAAAGMLGLGGDVVSHAFVFFVPAAAFFFAWLLARELTGSQIGAIVGGVFYAFNPVMLNKMSSGQASYMFGYCALPLAIWAYYRAMTSRSFLSAAGFGATLALAAVQLQLGIAAAFLTILMALLPYESTTIRQRLSLLLTGFLVAACIHLPTIVGITGGAPGYENLAQFSNSAAYMSMNSVSIWDAVHLMGYLTKYATVAIQQWSVLWYAAMAVVLAGVVLGIVASTKRFRIFAVVTLTLTFIFMAGTYSPFAFATVWLFQHVRYMQVFRELYHLMAVPALVYACALAFFFRYIGRTRAKFPAYVLTGIALFLVCAPMLSGDASGWVRAFPLQQAYGDALREQVAGNNRVLWLPMDQPLSFDGHGAGVDPMAVTERGSLWDYALNWPLTAVDSDIHDGGDLSTALRALSVGDIVDREGMQSELYRYTVYGADTEPFLTRRAPWDLAPPKLYRQSKVYHIGSPVPILSSPREIAFVPQRLSVCASTIVAGYAPVAFGARIPTHIPFAVLYDSGDFPEEALEFAHAVTPVQPTEIDARLGFAPVNAWWWHRKEYADVASLALTFDQHTLTTYASSNLSHATVVVAWVSSPAGGRIRVSVAGRSEVLDTIGNGEWRSRAIPFGKVANGAPVFLEALDYSAETAIRGFTILEQSKYDTIVASWRHQVHAATRRIAITQGVHEVLERSGSSVNLGVLQNGAYYRLKLESTKGVIRVGNSNGYVLARITDVPVAFRGDGTAARIVASRSVGSWRLYRVTRLPLRVPEAPAGTSPRLILWNWAYGDWNTTIAAVRIPSAIGTTIFALSQPGMPQIFYEKKSAYRLTFILGTAVLAVALLGLVRVSWRPVPLAANENELRARDVKA